MDRRSFFRSAIDKSSNAVGKAVVKAVDAKVKQQALNWIRPPFAKNELEFLLTCTRCNDCIEACPHHIIFSLSAKVGAKAAATPALDLINKGCHLCLDWPCVNACTVDALLIPANIRAASELRAGSKPELLTEQTADDIDTATEADDSIPLQPPRLAKVNIDTERCLPYSGPECGACVDSCPVDGALTLNMAKPIINQTLCTGCSLCRESCITEPKAITVASL